MFSKTSIAAAVAALALAVSGCATTSAPSSGGLNYNAQPNYGTVSLSGGFTPDPSVISLRAGGNLAANSMSSSCRGFITSAPDVRLMWNSGSLPLIISVNAATDTTLVVNGPDGSWYCDDDSGNGTNPSLRFNNPQSGRYEIWVGTYSSGASQPAQLYISEISSQ